MTNSRNMRMVARSANVEPIVQEILRQPWLWNEHTVRTENPSSPHHGLDDIWVRYNPLRNFTPDGGAAAFNQEHEAEWYPPYYALPSLRPLVFDLMRRVEGERLGGVLITRIPPGAMCKPHRDDGWHAKHYDKYAVQLQSAPGQAFCFGDGELEAEPGDVYWFNNLEEHWVKNPTNQDRMTLIVCIRSNRMGG